MDDAVAKSRRRHAAKMGLPRSAEAQAAYQAHRARMKTARDIEAVLREFRGNGEFGLRFARVGNKPDYRFPVTFASNDERRLAIESHDPNLIRAFYRAPTGDPIRQRWNAIMTQVSDRTGLPIEIVDESMPSPAQKAEWAADAARIQIIFKRRPYSK
jgi:hypothetical protein